MTRKKNTVYGLALNIMTVLSPVAMLMLLLHLSFGALPCDYVPWGSDEMDYWHETLSMRETGFNCGHYGYEEIPARIGPYGGHGFLFPLLYAGISLLTGWDYATPVYYNTAFLVLAWTTFLVVIRPRPRESLFYLALSVTFTPMFFWQGALMQEPMAFAVAIMLAALFSRFLESLEENQSSSVFKRALLSAVFLAALFRFTWAFLFFPLFIITRKQGSLMKPLAKASALLCFEMVFYTVFVAPYPYVPSLGTLIHKALTGNSAPLVERFHYNATEIFTNHSFFYFNLVIFELFFLVAICVILLAVEKRSTFHELPANRVRRRAAATCIFLTASLFTLFFVVHIVNGIILAKHISPMLLFGILVLSNRIPLRYSYIFVLINILILPAFLNQYRSTYYTSYVRAPLIREYIQTFQKTISPFVVYDPKASAWCNTLAMKNFPGVLSALPAGVAYNNVYYTDKLSAPLKSRYLLINGEEDRNNISRFNEIELLTKTSYGDLYLNTNTRCAPVAKRP